MSTLHSENLRGFSWTKMESKVLFAQDFAMPGSRIARITSMNISKSVNVCGLQQSLARYTGSRDVSEYNERKRAGYRVQCSLQYLTQFGGFCQLQLQLPDFLPCLGPPQVELLLSGNLMTGRHYCDIEVINKVL